MGIITFDDKEWIDEESYDNAYNLYIKYKKWWEGLKETVKGTNDPINNMWTADNILEIMDAIEKD